MLIVDVILRQKKRSTNGGRPYATYYSAYRLGNPNYIRHLFYTTFESTAFVP